MSERQALFLLILRGRLHMTKDEALARLEMIRREVERTPALSDITVKQVTDNAVDNQHPRGAWNVQLLVGIAGNLPKYIWSDADWQQFKAVHLERMRAHQR
jgi:hypothetical protein